MADLASRPDALQHIRFAGRPTAAAPRRHKPAARVSPPAEPAATHAHEPPGALIAWVFERAGLDAESYRGEPLRRRLPACLRTLHAHSEAEARRILEAHPGLLPAAVSALLIGATDFFRDPTVFEALRTEIFPKLARRCRPLRVWSAGCSNGAELYSLAILLSEAGLLEGSFLLGSDCRQDAIEEAEASLYPPAALEKLAAPIRRRYFDQAAGAWWPVGQLRRRVQWKAADLGRSIEPGPWDLILWRNMAIYLNADASDAIWHRLASALAPGGVLVAGKAERPPPALPLIPVTNCIYRACHPHAAQENSR